MKYLLFFSLIFISSIATAQRIDLKNINGVDYLIDRDTTPMGVITIKYIPTTNAISEAQSRLNSINGRIDEINAKIQELQQERQQSNRDKKEVEKIIVDLTPAAPKNFVKPKQKQ